MSTQPTALTVELNAEINKAVSEATSPEAIRQALIAEGEKQRAAQVDVETQKNAAEKAAADKAAEDARVAAAAQTFTKTEVIGGREFSFEASSELELANMVANAYRVAYAVQPDPSQHTQAPAVDPAVAQKAAADKAAADAAAKTELELKFKRGDISITDYIRQSGALDEYLAEKGVSIDSLKQSVEATQTTKFEQSWASATEEFLHSPEGADWPGGEQNKELIGLKIASLGLIDSEDKVLALKTAYADMKRTNMYFKNDSATQIQQQQQQTTQTNADKAAADLAAAQKAAAEKAAADAAAIAAQRLSQPIPSAARPGGASGLFGASSGVQPVVQTSAAATAGAKVDLPPTATPTEIMEAWKAAQINSGVNPDTAFMDTFRARR